MRTLLLSLVLAVSLVPVAQGAKSLAGGPAKVSGAGTVSSMRRVGRDAILVVTHDPGSKVTGQASTVSVAIRPTGKHDARTAVYGGVGEPGKRAKLSKTDQRRLDTRLRLYATQR